MTEEQTDSSQPTSITGLRPKMRLEGVVRRVELYGAFVDIGVGQDGLVHISQLSDRRVDRVSDVVHEGDRVTVWVTHVDPDQGRIGLTMVKPSAVEWRDLQEGQVYTGRIVRIERYGVFVDFGAERPGLLHIRQMGGQVFRHPSEVYREGDEIEVRVVGLDRRKKRIDLAIEESAEALSAEEPEADLPTPVELAFRRAQEEKRRQDRRRTAPEREEKQRAEQDDILARTLKQHTR